MKYKDFFVLTENDLREQTSDGPIVIDPTNDNGELDNLSVQPCEDIDLSKFGKVVPDYDAGKEVSAHNLYGDKASDKEIYEDNLIIAKDLLNKIGLLKDQRGLKTKLIKMGITGSKISSIISGLNYSGKGSYSTPEGKKTAKALLLLLKKIFLRGVNVWSDKGQLNEGMGNLKGLAAAGLMGMSQIITPGSVFASHSKPPVSVSSESRGIKNNNPGNIVKGTDKWHGMTGNDGKFLIFDTPENGIRALFKTLKTYEAKYNLNTVSGIISRWAPKNENDTPAYINFVCKKLGIKPDAKIDLNNKSIAAKLITAIIEKENGKNPYNDSIITSGINKA